jgi:hypothetical protein
MQSSAEDETSLSFWIGSLSMCFWIPLPDHMFLPVLIACSDLHVTLSALVYLAMYQSTSLRWFEERPEDKQWPENIAPGQTYLNKIDCMHFQSSDMILFLRQRDVPKSLDPLHCVTSHPYVLDLMARVRSTLTLWTTRWEAWLTRSISSSSSSSTIENNSKEAKSMKRQKSS